MDALEAIETCRSIRRLRPDPVPQELLVDLVRYATCAPSAGNSQHWRFLVVTGEEERRWFRDMLVEALGVRLAWVPEEGDTSSAARNQRMYRSFILDFDKIPAFVLTTIENAFPSREAPDPQFMWSSVYAATQNLLLAARALGLGAAMTTNHKENEPAVRAYFAIPDDVGIGATVPIGYPVGRYGPLTRRPVEEVVNWGRWDRWEAPVAD
ncbi:nitroreductase family protein [Nocardioides sp. QY071]|uniref:nitroreductase family protein n=1 Tax=Nocardioides sp. QY071 TaxID=3044187 RepID=UPI002499F7AF|nr:nitroreductase family protein [Nocardioides sp. QY071]WGY00355.1 nitroreductase family protein [Nocardioides sp. QY071]